MRPGPAPTPTALRLLKGETRPSRLNPREPHPRDGKPRPPAWLTPKARVIWRQAMRELEPMGVVTTADTTALGLYSQALAEYIAAKELVERDGLVVKGRDGGPIANPALRIERDRWMLVWRAGEAFGLTPSARVTLGSTMPTRMDELEQLLS